MSLCRGRLFFATRAERRSQDSSFVQTLNFNDSDDGENNQDGDVDSSVNDASMESLSPANTSSKKSPNNWASPVAKARPMTSPAVCHRSPRKALVSPIPFGNFDDSEDETVDDHKIPPLPSSPFTPPHKKLRSLRLYDTPHTPKSLLQKAQRRISKVTRSGSKSLSSAENTPSPRLALDPGRPQTNINPFTPVNNMNILNQNLTTGVKRPRNTPDMSLREDLIDTDMEEDMPSSKKLALHEINTSRYNEEFYEVCKLGDGEFGSVYKCINRLDGCPYAIKKSKTPVAGSVYERTAMNEVYAHAVLGKQTHVVRYYSAWAENDHMYIQNEYCNGGSLAELISQHRSRGQHFTEMEMKQILLQMAQGLKFIHSQNLVHLDIKPGNIFIHRNPRLLHSPESGLEEDMLDEDDEEETAEPITYKIGDLGHVTSLTNPVVEEGDCRYLPNEILQETFDHLPKADIFSLALTIYEAGSNVELPKNGETWHKIRQGELPCMSRYSQEFNALVKSMIHPDPKTRPSAVSLTHDPVLCPFSKKSRAQLRKELNEEKFKNELLTKKLKAATESKNMNSFAEKATFLTRQSLNQNGRSSRIIGRKVNRSMSMTTF